jgi:transposase
VREKVRKEREARTSGPDRQKYDLRLGQEEFPRESKRWAILRTFRYLVESGIAPEEVAKHCGPRANRALRSVEGEVGHDEFVHLAVDFHPELSRLGALFSLRIEPCEPFPKAESGGGNGVIHMGLLNIIRRMHLRQKLSIREIARLTGVSRNTVTKHLAANTIEPKFATPERQSKIDPFADKLAGWLKTEAGKSRKQRRTMKQLHGDLVALGFTGSYARVAAFARKWKADRQREQQTTGRGTFVPLHFDPGDAFQFDWSADFAVLGGERTKLQMAHIKLSHSRAFLLRAYPLQTHEMLFDANWHGFRVFGGVPGRGIYDNMKTAVDLVGRGKERQINMRFLAMTNHYVYEPQFCNPAAGWEKGQVEKNVRNSWHQMLQGMPDFPDLAALNAWLEERCLELWRETPHGKQPGTIADVWAEEQAALMPLPVAFDGFVELSKRVSPTCLISFERNRYSVPASFANCPVSLRIYPDRLVVAAEGNILCEHARVIQRNHTLPSRTIYDWRHYLAVVQRKPGALRNGAPFVELPSAFR